MELLCKRNLHTTILVCSVVLSSSFFFSGVASSHVASTHSCIQESRVISAELYGLLPSLLLHYVDKGIF